ncbi:MAG: acetyl-CoA carboxylase biotin carboxylase subunit [Alphaproteobacteria bacterium]|nr:acetyl-CoA carboxylase biotin carboxylase subunit [Alphaproteobacteria bacterium]MBT5861271.1 acetyl-CoA carboxylase biotin carboxylase subunit [Alphaproteobacteria bacterium]
MFEKILIASRGEVALRIHRACHEMGIQTVAVHSTADAKAMHVRLADEAVCIGPPAAADSYLNIPAIISAADITNTDAIHPGYGFLSENAGFVDIVAEHGITFIGPSADHIRLMGDKIAAKAAVDSLGIPVVPGSDGAVTSESQARKVANDVGYPVLIKASAGGGGRGMKLAKSDGDLAEAMSMARAEAGSSFGDDTVYIEKYLEHPRHIEVQVMADSQGNVIHLGERDCSLQRRNQKILEEARSPALNADQGSEIGEIVSKAIAKLGYLGAGTVEFLYEDGEFYFIEMNTRLQVEHPITEMITGVDIVREQIRIADGTPMGYTQNDVKFHGHAIECRINAEHPVTFAPSPGKITDYHQPGGLGVRVESALYSGYEVPPHYDSLISKLVVHGGTRNECLMRLRRALEEYVIGGIDTTLDLHRRLVEDPEFVDGTYDIHWLESFASRA